jgi:hypothetical protein
MDSSTTAKAVYERTVEERGGFGQKRIKSLRSSHSLQQNLHVLLLATPTD